MTTHTPLSRRAFGAGLATSLVLGPVAVRAATPSTGSGAARVAQLAQDYYEARLALFPMDATENYGDPKYEGAFEIDIAPAHRERQRRLYQRTLARLRAIDPKPLDADARLTWELLSYDLQDQLATLAYPWHLMPVGPMSGMHLRLSQYASGQSAQPMKTAANYDHFLARLKKLPAWIAQAIANMEQGMARGIVLPRELVERALPQFDAMLPQDPLASPFLVATREFPAEVSAADRTRITAAYRKMVVESVTPAVQKLRTFMAQRYLPAARTTAGLGALPGGSQWYRLLVKSSTTTSMTPAEIHELGLKEVARIRAEMEGVKAKFGFTGSLDAFIQSLDTRPELTPFHTEEEVLAAYRAINERVKAGLPRLFERGPKAPLDVRLVDPIQRDTASDNYMPPASDGSRPGVFYLVVQDAPKHKTVSMVSLFLHEGQPGHHYQIALQRELATTPYRQSVWYDAFGEGWALYAEGLGRELGLYDDPVAYLGRLFMELHRALRLVVDTGLHDKGWSRQQAIDYLREKEGSKERNARQAVERYMSWPGQALAYKVGELKILQLREKARQALGSHFDIRAFHTQVLGSGCVPLPMLQARVEGWIAAQR